MTGKSDNRDRGVHLFNVYLRASLASALALSLAGVGHAQGAVPAASVDSGASGSGDIIVTAQRRSERLAEVPISVQAIDAQTLSRTGVISTMQLIALAPSVSFTSGYSVAATSVTIRGISSVSTEGAGVQPSTAIVLDDVGLSRQGEFVTDFGDLDSVQVLRGPQGTLFGKNATAGVVSITTKKPSKDVEGVFEAGYTTDDEFLVRGVANIPFSDAIRLRVNAFRRELQPLVKNQATTIVSDNMKGAAGDEAWGLQGKLAIDFSERADILISADYTKRRSSFGTLFNVVPNSAPNLSAIQAAAETLAGSLSHPVLNADVTSEERTTSGGVSANLRVDLTDDLVLRSITAYRTFKDDNLTGADGGPWGAWRGVGVLPNPFQYPIVMIVPDNAGFPYAPDKTKYFSQELRLNYKSGPLDLVAGGYLQRFRNRRLQQIPYLIANGADASGNLTYGFLDDHVSSRMRDDIYSAFADATYTLSPSIFVFGGLRYSHEKLRLDHAIESWANAPYDPITLFPTVPGSMPAAGQFRARDSVDNLSGRAGVRYSPSRQQSYYASYNRGYKGPAIDNGRLATAATAFLKPETADAFEIGTKQSFFDNRLQANLSLFYEKIHDIQQSALATGTNLVRLQNAGTVKSYGAEFDMNWRVSDSLRLDGGLAWTHATYKDFSNNCYPGQTAPQGCVGGVQDLTGTPATGAPRFSGNIAANYDVTLPDNLPFNAFVRVAYNYKSKVQYGLTADPFLRESGHGLLDATLGLVGRNDAWQILLYGKNLTNKHYYAFRSEADNFLGRTEGFLSRDFKRYGGLMLKLTI